MPDTFDTLPVSSLPTVTRALRQAWITASPGNGPYGYGNGIDAVAAPFAMRAVLDAIHALELRIVALGG
jgi:hypothetical protein